MSAAKKTGMTSLAPLVKKVIPSVVNISSLSQAASGNPLVDDPELSNLFDMPTDSHPGTKSLGSGVIVNAQLGYIVTNSHVIQDHDKIVVSLEDDRIFRAKIIGSDPESDIAVIQINADNLVAISFADSKKIKVGDFVVAIGNTFGLGQSVSSGIISALGRSGFGPTEFIQTDATINPGNTGGPLLNLKGQLVGINTAILGTDGANIGISFAIPSNIAHDRLMQLVEFGKVKRRRLGIRVQANNNSMRTLYNLKSKKGVVVTHVAKHSLAEKSKMKHGDLLTHINGIAINNPAEVHNILAEHQENKLSISVIRRGRLLTLEIGASIPNHLSEAIGGEQVNVKLAGATISNIGSQHPLYGRVQGVVLRKVFKGSPAWLEGLRSEDVVVSVNRQTISNVEEMRRAAKSRRDRTLLNIKRGKKALFILVR